MSKRHEEMSLSELLETYNRRLNRHEALRYQVERLSPEDFEVVAGIVEMISTNPKESILDALDSAREHVLRGIVKEKA